jgi:hypothetical protein
MKNELQNNADRYNNSARCLLVGGDKELRLLKK